MQASDNKRQSVVITLANGDRMRVPARESSTGNLEADPRLAARTLKRGAERLYAKAAHARGRDVKAALEERAAVRLSLAHRLFAQWRAERFSAEAVLMRPGHRFVVAPGDRGWRVIDTAYPNREVEVFVGPTRRSAGDLARSLNRELVQS